jgi:hypothetical protein
MSKNLTKLTWWWCDSISKNMTNQGDRAGDVVVLGVSLDFVALEVLYLWWFLCGERISDGPAETVMVGECWSGDVMLFCMVRTLKKMSRVRTTLNSYFKLLCWGAGRKWCGEGWSGCNPKKWQSDPMESEMENNGSRIPKVRKADADAGAQKDASALNTVSKVLRIANLFSVLYSFWTITNRRTDSKRGLSWFTCKEN